MDEFELISTFFHNKTNNAFCVEKKIIVGIGDDAAVFELAAEEQLVSSIDTLIENVHFPKDASPESIAHKALAVNLSDLAAMGAKPHSFTLSLSLPAIDNEWLQDFSSALFSLANRYEVVLIGGDTCKGPLSISIQINGTVTKNQFLLRSTAKAGDKIFVSGCLGLAALGLAQWQQNLHRTEAAQQRFLFPEPRLGFASQLYPLGVRCCIDISDGLSAELHHLSNASGLSIRFDSSALLVHAELQSLDAGQRRWMMLSGGDDYELCFAVPAGKQDAVIALARQYEIALSYIGEFFSDNKQNRVFDLVLPEGSGQHERLGYQHF